MVAYQYDVTFIEKARRAMAAYSPRVIEGSAAMPAGVLVPIYPWSEELRIILTMRTDEVEHHKGEISFPGGAFDREDADLKTTALREAYEEAGIRPEDVEIIGQLDDFVTITDFLVRPFVGIIKRTPYDFIPNEQEVAAILEVPLPHLLDKANLTWETRERRGQEVIVYTYQYGEYAIWGATARILKQFLDLISPA